MRLRLLAVIMLVLVLPVGVAQAAPAKYKSATVNFDSSHGIVLSSAKGSMTLVAHSHGPSVLGVTENRYRYRVGTRAKPLATVWLTVR